MVVAFGALVALLGLFAYSSLQLQHRNNVWGQHCTRVYICKLTNNAVELKGIECLNAGPEAMYAMTKQICASINSNAPSGAPSLFVSRQAYTLQMTAAAPYFIDHSWWFAIIPALDVVKNNGKSSLPTSAALTQGLCFSPCLCLASIGPNPAKELSSYFRKSWVQAWRQTSVCRRACRVLLDL